MKRLKWVGLAVVAAAALLAVVLRVRYGGGDPYSDLTGQPLLPESALEVVVVSREPVGNVAASPSGRLFFSIHPESRPSGAKVLEWKDGKAVPFPDREIQHRLLVTPLGPRVDARNRLWVIDHGNHGVAGARLVAFDLASGALAREIRFDRTVAPLGSFLQDFAIDRNGDFAYVADVSFWRKSPAVVVVDLRTGRAHRALERHPSVTAQDWIIESGKRMTFFGGLVALKAGVDGIALSPDDEWVVYAAMNHDGLYRVRAADLRGGRSGPGDGVERIATKPLSDGIATDVAGNVLITDVEHGAVLRTTRNGGLETLVRSPRIRWADGFSFGPDGWLYLADSAIPDQMLRSKSHMAANAPYHVYRFRPGIEGIPGR